MRFATRIFAFCLIPLALVLGISFWYLQATLQQTVREDLRADVRDRQFSMTEGFDPAVIGVPVVLSRNGRILQAAHTGASSQQLGAAIGACGVTPECDLQINGRTYLSIRMHDAALGDGYVLRSLQSVDRAAAPMEAALRRVFLSAALGAVLIAFAVSAGVSHTMRPVTDVVAHLRSHADGLLAPLPASQSSVMEIRELIGNFNRAASAIRDARDDQNAVYVEFVGSLAHALDARDGYTAGHSERVSRIATTIAEALDLPVDEREVIRVGALLHDIGKIGIPDFVLQKTGVLSDAEFALIKQHPTIGCRILEGVRGFSDYLPVVEMHHENWDGTGYPYGLSGKAVPLAARIVHVADAWDAMTSNRPYRYGFTHARALAIIQFNAGTQFDPEISELFVELMKSESATNYQLAAVADESPVSVED